MPAERAFDAGNIFHFCFLTDESLEFAAQAEAGSKKLLSREDVKDFDVPKFPEVGIFSSLMFLINFDQANYFKLNAT